MITKPPQCPKCGEPAVLSNGAYGVRAQCCGLWSWNGKPLVDGETHVARIRAHAAFDPLWRNSLFKRGEGYRRLALAMGMPREACHIATMSRRDALRVVEIVRSGKLAIDPDFIVIHPTIANTESDDQTVKDILSGNMPT